MYIQPEGIGYLVRAVFYDQIFKPNSACTSECKQGSLMADNYNLIEGLTYIRGQNKVYVPFSYYGRSTIQTVFKKRCEFLLRKRSMHCFYGFRTGETLTHF